MSGEKMFKELYEKAFNNFVFYMESTELEPTSAMKQAASDVGIPEGEEMGKFVEFANKKVFG